MPDRRQQIELEALVKEVLNKQDRIIPIVGDDCFVGTIEYNNGTKILVPLQQWLAKKLIGEAHLTEEKRKLYADGYGGLDMLSKDYRLLNDIEGFNQYKDDVIYEIDNGVEKGTLFLRKDVKDFLMAGRFEVIATTCPYHILEKELKFGAKPYNVSSFAPTSKGGSTSKSESSLALPAIYKIFGDCDGEFVYGEESLLKFLHYLNQTGTEKGYGASPLVKYIKDKGQDRNNKGLGLLMPIGCNNLPNWLFRFLWYPFSQYNLVGKDDNNQGGIWHKYSEDTMFYTFLRRYNFKTFSGPICHFNEQIKGDPVLAKLTEEFKNRESKLETYAKDELAVKWNDSDEWDFFISYANEDVGMARKVYDILTEKCGKRAWMDNRGNINFGDEYWSAIEHGIEHSHKFLFIITNSYLRKAIDKNHVYDNGDVRPTGVYQEIELIKRHFLAKRIDGKKGYAFPLILEGTTVTYTDYQGNTHENEMLLNGVLETLPKYKEYEMLQTDVLFHQIQDMVISDDTVNDLITAFNS